MMAGREVERLMEEKKGKEETSKEDHEVTPDPLRRLNLDEPLLSTIGTVEDVDLEDVGVPAAYRRDSAPALPVLAEFEAVRHYTRLSTRNFGIDKGIYPLGSCTMKYNPKFAEVAAAYEGFARLHPEQDPATCQGALQLMWELQEMIKTIVGMDAVTLQPPAGAAGEFTGLLIARAHHAANGDGETRDEVLIPDTAHGTNPATAGMCGYKVVEIPSTEEGEMDLEALKAALSERTAALMLTNPSTLGVFESQILEVARLVHEAGALLYYDGANLNAILGRARPGDMGFDIVHLNLHKTFATPHGGGGPGAGPVGVRKGLVRYLPTPRVRVRRTDAQESPVFDWEDMGPQSIGKVHGHNGNFGMLVRAHAYIRRFGAQGLRSIADIAVLNANWLKSRLKPMFEAPHRDLVKHEFVLSASTLKRERGVRTMDIAKRLLDHDMHAPTVYFPLVVDEAMMIEPTESEPLSELQRFVDVMQRIVEEDPDSVRSAPHKTPVGRLDEAWAARKRVLSWQDAARRIDEVAPGPASE